MREKKREEEREREKKSGLNERGELSRSRETESIRRARDRTARRS